VQVRAEGGLGRINADGLQSEGQAYVNEAYGDSDVTLDVEVRGGVGQIDLQVDRERREDQPKEER
jgi:hypothetical protein